MLPQLPVDLPSIPQLPALPSIMDWPGSWSGFSWGWIAGGAALSLISLWALRRARRMVVAATVGVAGLVLAWNAGFLPLVS